MLWSRLASVSIEDTSTQSAWFWAQCRSTTYLDVGFRNVFFHVARFDLHLFQLNAHVLGALLVQQGFSRRAATTLDAAARLVQILDELFNDLAQLACRGPFLDREQFRDFFDAVLLKRTSKQWEIIEQGFSTRGTRPPGGSLWPIQGGTPSFIRTEKLYISLILHTLLYIAALNYTSISLLLTLYSALASCLDYVLSSNKNLFIINKCNR